MQDTDWEDLFPALVYYHGLVTWTPIGEFSSSCDLNMLRFPFDEHICDLYWTNFVHSKQLVAVERFADNINLDFYTQSSEFDIIKGTIDETEYSTCLIREGFQQCYDYPGVKFSIQFKRLPLYYVYQIFIPCLLLILLSVLTFMIPVDAGEKLGYGMTVMLSFSVYMLILGESTPQSSRNIPVISKYYQTYLQFVWLQ